MAELYNQLYIITNRPTKYESYYTNYFKNVWKW